MWLAAALAWAQVAVPALSARVIDLTGTLSGATVTRIESELADLEARKGSQVAVLIVPTTKPEEIEQFGIRVAERWRLGRKGVDDGAILIVAKDDRRVRIEVGYGLEGALPDATANRIVDEAITPRFRAGDFDGGVQAGAERMIGVINGEPLPEPDHQWERARGLGLGHMLPLLLVAVFVVSGVLRAMFGRLFGSIATGGVAGALAYLISHILAIGFGAGAIAFLFALLMGSSRGWAAGGGGWGGVGGFGGGLGGGGFGGGGFSGGGGGFGGGGASGRW
ncbi:MAG: TPM domain-containing protein [Steroidobacterales bacterium]